MTPSAAAAPALVPAPAEWKSLPGRVRLADGLQLEAPEELAAVARWFRRLAEASSGWRVEIVAPGEGTDGRGREANGGNSPNLNGRIRLALAPAGAAARGAAPVGAAARGAAAGDPARGRSAGEAYELVVADGGVTITGSGAPGVFYGLQTLRQLLPVSWWRAAARPPAPPVELAGTEISDAPAYAWRGVHLDVARHFMPKSFLLELIDLASAHKCNVLHLHLTDDQGWRMPVDAYPRLVEVGAWRRQSPLAGASGGDGRPHGGYYSTEDLREVVAYAGERFVEVLPEIDMPGHMVAAIAAYPELGNTPEQREVLTRWGISSHVLNLRPSTLEFCTEVLDAVADVFSWEYLHVGGDECPTAEWEASAEAQALMREEGFSRPRQLQGWFTARMAEHLARRGRRLVGWDEILEGGAPPGAVVMSWRGLEGGIEAAVAGHDVVMVPQQWLYFDWANSEDPREPPAFPATTTLERVWSFDPLPDDVPAERRHHILGGQCQLWTEFVPGPEHAEYMYFPRLCAFAEVVWRGAAAADLSGTRTFAEFEERLGAHLRRLDALGVNYRPLAGPTPGQSRIWQGG